MASRLGLAMRMWDMPAAVRGFRAAGAEAAAGKPDGDDRPQPLGNHFPAALTCRCRVCPCGARRLFDPVELNARARFVVVEAGMDGKLQAKTGSSRRRRVVNCDILVYVRPGPRLVIPLVV